MELPYTELAHWSELAILTCSSCPGFQTWNIPCPTWSCWGLNPGTFCMQNRCFASELHPFPSSTAPLDIFIFIVCCRFLCFLLQNYVFGNKITLFLKPSLFLRTVLLCNDHEEYHMVQKVWLHVITKTTHSLTKKEWNKGNYKASWLWQWKCFQCFLFLIWIGGAVGRKHLCELSYWLMVASFLLLLFSCNSLCFYSSQNKEFVCRGHDYERLEAFQQRMLNEFPHAIAMQHANQPDETIFQAEAQCIHSVDSTVCLP